MRVRRITIWAAFAAGLAALPLSTAKAQYHPHQQQPTAQSTANQLNREELARHQSGNGYPPYYWASGSPWGWGWGYPSCSSPFPLFWPFCMAGALVVLRTCFFGAHPIDDRRGCHRHQRRFNMTALRVSNRRQSCRFEFCPWMVVAPGR
jgi:hypothetical protein